MHVQTLFSLIRPEVKGRLFRRALLTASPGISLLLCMGIFAPIELVDRWGIAVFAVGIFLIGWGMIPYRRVSRLELKPHRIEFSETEIAGIALKEIESLTYVEGKRYYGIRLIMKNGKRLNFPYFSKSAYASLHDVMHPNESD
ncbi:MAG: hypothetical protein K1060chlam2_01492 [Chlamydiae bacterium]|nr:hypothetical protein [Chlamydiota bacterium]